MVKVGDYRHYIILEVKYWNRLLGIIRNNELDADGMKAITKGLIERGLPEEYEDKFISAVKRGVIKDA